MRKGLLAALTALLTSAHLALAQGPAGLPPPSPMPQPVFGPEQFPVDGGPAEPVDSAPGEDDRFWFGARGLTWWFKSSPFPIPLVTTTTDLTTQPLAGLGPTTTSVLLGNQSLGTGAHGGAHLYAGTWVDAQRTVAFEAGYFIVSNQSVVRSVTSSGQAGSPALAVPFFDVDATAESTFTLASPGIASGGAVLSLRNQLQGAEANGLVTVCSAAGLRVDILAGFRFLDLREDAGFATFSTGTQPPGPGSNNGLILNTDDRFNTHNQFYGCQIGARGEYRLENFLFNATAKVGLGEAYQVVTLGGATVTNFFNAPAGGPFTGAPTQLIPGTGTFVQASNVGRASRDQMAVVGEVGLSVGYQVTRWARLFVGYDFLYWSNVARPGNQVDRFINSSQTLQSSILTGNPTATGTRPAEVVTGSSFWAQGINLGLELNF